MMEQITIWGIDTNMVVVSLCPPSQSTSQSVSRLIARSSRSAGSLKRPKGEEEEEVPHKAEAKVGEVINNSKQRCWECGVPAVFTAAYFLHGSSWL